MAAMDGDRGVRAASRRRFVLPAIALVAVALVGVVISLLVRRETGRDPIEFLPAQAAAAVDFDSRVSAPAAVRLAKTWSAADVRRLSERATEVAQKVVDWSGFDLDIKKDVLPWYGGEVVVASLAQKEMRPLSPDTLVLVARTKSMRGARASLEKAVRSFAREAEWRRRVESREGETVVFWVDRPGRDQIAYAVKDNCLVVSRHPALVGECLRAAKQPSRQLGQAPRFRTTAGKMDEEGGAWAYFDVAATARAGKLLAPVATTANWVGVVRDYLRRHDRESATTAAADDEDLGVIAVGVTPEPKGVRLRGVYRGAGDGAVRPVTPARVVQFAPREAAAYLFLRNPGERWLRMMAPDPFGSAAPESGPSAAGSLAQTVMSRLLPPPTAWLGFTRAPTEVLVVVLPRGHGSRPALAVVAPEDQVATPPRGILAALSRQTTSAVVGDLEIVGTDAQAVKACEAAMKSPRARLSPAPAEGARFDAWVKPAALSHRFGQITEIRVQGREVEGGGEGELSIIAPPRYLLGE
jgi:hypothetical protein